MSQESDRALNVAVGGLLALVAAMGIGRFVYTPILPFMTDGLSLSEPNAGLIASSNYLGYLLGALTASSAAFGGERRRWLLSSLAVSSVTTAAMGAWASVAGFSGIRFIGGFASAFVFVFATALVLDHLAAVDRSRLVAIHFAGVGSGIVLSAVIVSVLAANGADWRRLWLAAAGISLLALVAVARLVPVGSRTGPPPMAQRDRVRNTRLATLILAYGLFGFGYVITATFISTIVRSTPAVQSLESVIWLIVGLAAVPSVAVWTWAAQRMGNRPAFALACLVEAVGVALSVLALHPVAIVAAAILLGGTFVGITAVGLIEARHLATGDPRRSLAYMTAAFGLGQMIGPTFAGFAHRVGNSFLFPSLVAASALVVASALVLRWPVRHGAHQN